VLVKALSKDREKRYQTAADLEKALAGIGGGGARTQGIAVAQPTAMGVCAECGHQHPVDPANPLARKFCESCGRPLIESCVKCSTPNGVWSKFCSSCGVDLAAAVQAASAELEAERARIGASIRRGEFDQALANSSEWLRRNTRTSGRSLRGRARRPLGSKLAWRTGNGGGSFYDLVLGVAYHKRAELARVAREHLKAYRFQEAAQCLDSLPAGLHTAETRGLVEQTRAALTEIVELRKQIREKVQTKQLLEVKPLAQRLLKLQPGNAEVRDLIARIEQQEAKEEEASWNAANHKGTLAAYRRHLADYPRGPHALGVRERLGPLLRAELLANLADAAVRTEYLATRTDQLREEDVRLARNRLLRVFAITGAASGALIGAVVGAITMPWGGIIGGVVGGSIAAWILAERAK